MEELTTWPSTRAGMERLGESHLCKTISVTVTSITNIYSLVQPYERRGVEVIKNTSILNFKFFLQKRQAGIVYMIYLEDRTDTVSNFKNIYLSRRSDKKPFKNTIKSNQIWTKIVQVLYMYCLWSWPFLLIFDTFYFKKPGVFYYT